MTTAAATQARADYATLLDDEIRAFIARTEALYPADAVTATIARQREIYDMMAAAFRQPRPVGVRVADRPVAGVPCRIYEPEGSAGAAAATVIYFHGGGFVVGGLDSHDDVCAEIAAATGYPVVSADYRLAPEHRHPAAYHDCLAVAEAIAAEAGRPLVLAGDSAGGNLAAAVAQSLKGKVALAGLVLVYPGLSRRPRPGGSIELHAEAPMLTRADVDFYRAIRLAEDAPDTPDPTAAPLDADDLSGLPPTYVSVAECDPLADDGVVYAERIRAAGGTARAIVEPGLVHGSLRARRMSRRARDAFARTTDAIAAFGRGDPLPF